MNNPEQQKVTFLSPKEYGNQAKKLNRVKVVSSVTEYRSAFMHQASADEAAALNWCYNDLEKQATALGGNFLVMHKRGVYGESHSLVSGVISRKATVYKLK